MMRIVGYEGGRYRSICTYASAAMMDDEGALWNAPSYDWKEKNGNEALAKHVRKGHITLLEAPIELPDQMADAVQHSYFVYDMPLDIALRAPYALQYNKITAMVHKYAGSSYGTTRAYHAFQTMKDLQLWLARLHIGNKFVMKEY